MTSRVLRRPASLLDLPGHALSHAVSYLRAILNRARQRAALAALDDHLLDDVGLTHEDVRAELRRSIWR